jgi:hypothetical protein
MRHRCPEFPSAFNDLYSHILLHKRRALQRNLITLGSVFALTFMSAICLAAPDDRGAMGGVFSLSGGGVIGFGDDEEGSALSSFLGQSMHLSFGEEVSPRLFIGLGFDGYFGATQDDLYALNLFCFGMEGRYRLSASNRGLIILGGIGVGGGGFSPIEGAQGGGSAGGSMWKLGLGYEINLSGSNRGFTLTPRLLYQRLGPQMESVVTINAFTLNIELMWSTGRSTLRE